MSKIMDSADALGKLIHECEEYKNYISAKETHDKDSELQVMIGEFNLKRMAIMQEAKKDDKDEAKLTSLQTELRDVYEKVMANENMVKFVAAKEAFDALVNEMYGILNFYITGQQPGACSGSCDSCGGCH